MENRLQCDRQKGATKKRKQNLIFFSNETIIVKYSIVIVDNLPRKYPPHASEKPLGPSKSSISTSSRNPSSRKSSRT
jgi:hypothetical protein